MTHSRIGTYCMLLLLLWGAAAGPAAAASPRHTVLVSDLHVGAGKDAGGKWKRFEDFRWQEDFDAFLDMVSERSAARADLVLVGDIFELWQSPHMACSTDLSQPGCNADDCRVADTNLGCGEEEAVERLRLVLGQHADFIKALQRFAAKGTNRVVFVPGNHDAALLFPAVRTLLLRQFAHPRVSVAAEGYWLSEDGAIYADHGHQFDEVNKFAGWPRPFKQSAGRNHLVRPWGENMVQQFYNQYESVFPIIDNLSDESAGVSYAVQQAGFPDSAGAIRRFFRFFLFQQSLRQAGSALGSEGRSEWNVAALRGEDASFFMDVIAVDPHLRALGGQLRPGAADGFEPGAMSAWELDALCIAKEQVAGARRCPRTSTSLSALTVGATTTPQQRLVSYLRTTLPQVAAPGARIASVYVFGHTHAAALPVQVSLGDMAFGSADVTTVNTGAFQRIATPGQIDAILRTPAQRGKRPLDLQPEDLPACYTFVWIAPYSIERKPVPQVQRWSRDMGQLRTGEGTCHDVAL